MKNEQKEKQEIFTRRYEFYWQFLAVYAITLLVYGIFKGTINDGKFSIILKDPLVILLALFIIITVVGLLINIIKNPTIVISKEYIILKTRFRQKVYKPNEIIKIALGKEKRVRFRNIYPVIKIQVTSRKRLIRIKPSSYLNERELVHSFNSFKKANNK